MPDILDTAATHLPERLVSLHWVLLRSPSRALPKLSQIRLVRLSLSSLIRRHRGKLFGLNVDN